MGAAPVPHPPATPGARVRPSPFTRVLALADPADNGAIAVTHAGLLADACAADILVFHALDLGPIATDVASADNPGHGRGADRRGSSPEMGYGAVGSAAERLARAALESLVQATGVPRARRSVLVERGPASAATMADAASRYGADVVVMAPHSRGRIASALATSLTRATIERVHDRVAVLCARGEARPYRRILVATDFGPRSRRAFRLAARIGALFGAEVSVLHVAASAGEVAAARAALARFLPMELARLAPRMLVETGEAWEAIVGAAERTAADLVIVSTGGRDGLGDAVLGSTAERIVRHAPCPVMVS